MRVAREGERAVGEVRHDRARRDRDRVGDDDGQPRTQAERGEHTEVDGGDEHPHRGEAPQLCLHRRET
jgi:hypothetical protein